MTATICINSKPAPGELLETSRCSQSVASWDMAFCQYLEEDAALSVYGTYICAPERIMDNNQLVYVLDLSNYHI